MKKRPGRTRPLSSAQRDPYAALLSPTFVELALAGEAEASSIPHHANQFGHVLGRRLRHNAVT